MTEVISREMWCVLPPRVRLAAGAALADKILQLYSKAFRKRFLQESNMKLVWQYVNAEPHLQPQLDQAIDESEFTFETAESEGYDFYEVCIPISLVEEILQNDGKGIVCAMCGIEIAYLHQVLYHHHIAPTDRRLNKFAEDVDSIQKMVQPVIHRVYESAKGVDENRVSDGLFSSIEFPAPSDWSLLPESLHKIMKKPSKPELIPKFERNK